MQISTFGIIALVAVAVVTAVVTPWAAFAFLPMAIQAARGK